MAAKIMTVSSHFTMVPFEAERLWFYPDGSNYLKYSPHFHIVHHGGFRQNLPLCYMFVVVLEGKLSVKDFWGQTINRIDVRDQVWYLRGQHKKMPHLYAKIMYPLYQPEYETEAQWIREVR